MAQLCDAPLASETNWCQVATRCGVGIDTCESSLTWWRSFAPQQYVPPPCAMAQLCRGPDTMLDAKNGAFASTVNESGARCRACAVRTLLPGFSPVDHPLRRLKPDERIVLEPLSPDDLAPLGRPDLHERTGGNPRFIEEEMAGAHSPQRSSTLSEALVAQCRAEGRWSYRILLAACLLEQPFAPAPLAELVGTDPDPLTEELERLCERRILRVDGVRFRFRYDLIRRVLLDSISPARQRLLQERLVRTFSDSSMPTASLG